MDRLIVALVLVPPVILAGGVHPRAQLGLFVFYAVGLTAAIALRSAKRQPVIWHPLLLVFFAFGAVALAQTVSLPIAWVDKLSPETALAVRHIDAVFGTESVSAALSLDTSATRVAAVRWWTVAMGVFWLLQTAQSHRALRSVPRVVIGLGVFVIIVGIVQQIVGTDALYGLFEPLDTNAGVGFGGPFVNPNHAGHFLLLSATICLVLIASGSGTRRSRGLLVGLVLVFAIGIVANGSRGALLGLAAAPVVLALVHWVRRGSRSSGKQDRTETVAIVVGMFVAVAGLVVLKVPEITDLIVANGSNLPFENSKLTIQRAGWALALDFPWTGMGADAYSSAQVALAPLTTYSPAHTATVENDSLQLLIDFGFVIPVLVVALALVAMRRGGRSERSRRAAFWLVVVIPFVLYTFASFAMLSVGLMVPFVGLIAMRWLRRCRASPPTAYRIATLAIVAAMAVTAVAVHPLLATSPDPLDRRALHELARQRPLDGRSLWAVALAGYGKGLSRTEVDDLADAARALSGNDFYLKEALARYHFAEGRDQLAWDLVAAAMTDYPRRRSELAVWVGNLDEPEAVHVVCERHPVWCAPILEQLRLDDRYSDVLQAALLLPDSIEILYYRVLASQRLGERWLASRFAEQLMNLDAETRYECRLQAEGLANANRRADALQRLAACIERASDDDILLMLYVRRSLYRDADDAPVDARADEYLRQLNVMIGDDDRLRRQHAFLMALSQASHGQCQAAALSLANSRDASGETESLPDWARRACPSLTPTPDPFSDE